MQPPKKFKRGGRQYITQQEHSVHEMVSRVADLTRGERAALAASVSSLRAAERLRCSPAGSQFAGSIGWRVDSNASSAGLYLNGLKLVEKNVAESAQDYRVVDRRREKAAYQPGECSG